MIVIRKTGLVVGIAVCIVLTGSGFLWWYISHPFIKPISDVPIEYKIGWWSYQEAVTLDNFTTSVVFENISLFGGASVVEYNLEGKLYYKANWRPYIKSVHVSERWEVLTEYQERIASIVITPIVGVNNDETYTGELVEFKIKVQDYLDSGGWGINIYKVTSLGKKSEIKFKKVK